MSDEMPVNVCRQRRYFLLQFLHAALAEVSFSGLVGLTNRLYGVKLTHAYQGHIRRYVCAHALYVIRDLLHPFSHLTYGVM